MLDNPIYLFDLECNNLLDKATKIHCLVYYDVHSKEFTQLSDYQQIKEFVERENITLVGHNIIRFDIPILRKILNANIRCDLIDTLPLSWILDEIRKSHSLASYSEEFSIPKVDIENWENGAIESYFNRAKEDVKINTTLWKRQYKHLKYIYGDDVKNLERYFKYLRFKMECVHEQEVTGVALDVEKAERNFEKLTALKEEKTVELELAMPKVAIKKKKVYKDAFKGEDGNIYQKGDLFFDSVPKEELSDLEEVKILGWDEPNANSHVQIKNWLFSLGWKPANILHKRDKKTNEIKLIPQVKSAIEPGEVCDSVKLLFEKEPKLEVLNGLSILTHRIGIFSGFINERVDGRLYPSMNGLTNTLRLKHRVIVNLPRFDRAYGKEVRECLIADEGCILCGTDLKGIEDATKRHFIYDYDPEYVERMNVDGYDSHLELAVLAKLMTAKDVEWYKWYEEQKDVPEFIPTDKEKNRYEKLKAQRYVAKQINFSSTYKIGAKALSIYPGINLGMKEAKRVINIYWKLNKAILDVENTLEIKEVYGQMWLFNPISRFWYSLRALKDKFSTLNQGTAVYIFDLWLTNIRKEDVVIPFQYHDEAATNCKKADKKKLKSIILGAMDKVNEKLKLNVELKCSVEWGKNYAEIH